MAGKNAQTQKNVAKSATIAETPQVVETAQQAEETKTVEKTTETPQVLPLEKKASEMKKSLGLETVFYCNEKWFKTETEAKTEGKKGGFAYYIF